MTNCCQVGRAAPDSYTPLGRYTNIGGLNSYVSDDSAPSTTKPRALLLLLPDGFGLAKHNLILADEFAKEGYRVVIPDYFEGDPLPIQVLKRDRALSIDDQPWPERDKQVLRDLDFEAWLRRHDHDRVSRLLEGVMTKISRDSAIVVGVGYCFGGKHVLRLGKSARLAAVASFHPSFVEAEDMRGVRAPVYIGLAGEDDMVPASLSDDLRAWSSSGMEPNVAFGMETFPGVGHGFAARPDTDDEVVRGQYRRAFLRTLEHFAKFVPGRSAARNERQNAQIDRETI
ncbi:hypothetical protein PV04_05114 [Phialophora macrospora]|uniref:Dienelactone hydrolase domain-containing protein n=1 Tax=Phialophora macrospora TaxID=1851006 RepID=A0A0D2CVP6_9EURO|nr:hypothetical protein PV04_05114 [Phialophora macrospora]